MSGPPGGTFASRPAGRLAGRPAGGDPGRPRAPHDAMPPRGPAMNRVLWFAMGAGAGVYALTKVRRAAEALTPDGLADRLAGLSLGAHLFADEVRTGMAEKEMELRGRLTLPLHGATPQLPGGEALADTAGTSGTPEQPEDTREGND